MRVVVVVNNYNLKKVKVMVRHFLEIMSSQSC